MNPFDWIPTADDSYQRFTFQCGPYTVTLLAETYADDRQSKVCVEVRA